MDRFYGVGTRVLIETDAIVERFMGDQVIGYYLPVFAGQGHARKAIAAARQLLVATGHGGGAEPWVPVGAGVHTGIAWVGAIGNPGQMTEFTALGDAVNIAARLASSAAAGQIFVSDASAAAAGVPEDAGEHRVIEAKGKSEPLGVRVLGVEMPVAGPI
jgi:adenylate cyclase